MQSAETWPLSFVIYKIKIVIIQSSNEELLIEMSLRFPYPNRWSYTCAHIYSTKLMDYQKQNTTKDLRLWGVHADKEARQVGE